MRKLLIPILFFIASSASAQTRKPDSLQLQITMDTATFKFIISLIKENIDQRSNTGKLILSSILTPLSNFKLVGDSTYKPAKKPK